MNAPTHPFMMPNELRKLALSCEQRIDQEDNVNELQTDPAAERRKRQWAAFVNLMEQTAQRADEILKRGF